MSVVGYNITNVSAAKDLNLKNGSATEFNNIIAFTEEDALNSKWRCIPVPSGQGLYNIQTPLGNLFLGIPDPLAQDGQAVVATKIPMPWALVPVGNNSHAFRIQVPYTDLYVAFPSGDSGTNAILRPFAKLGDYGTWNFKLISA